MNSDQSLPKAALFALFLSGFVSLSTEALPAGLLPEISQSLGITSSLAGQTITIYALATALGAIPLARLTVTWSRKRVLQTALSIVTLANILTAVSTDYWFTMAVRFMAGLGTAMVWPLLAVYAASLAPNGKQGKAVAFALAGNPVGLALGIPLGTALGSIVSWQLVFVICALFTFANLIYNHFCLPDVAGRASGQRPSMLSTLSIPGFVAIVVALIAYMVAHNIIYTYITDYLASSDLSAQTGWVLFTFGAASILSILLVSSLIDAHLRKLALISSFGLAFSMLVMAIFAHNVVLVYLAVAAWGLVFGSSASLFMSAAIHATGDQADIAQAITVTAFSGSISFGAFIGGILLASFGAIALTWTAGALLVVSGLIIFFGKKHAFPAV